MCGTKNGYGKREWPKGVRSEVAFLGSLSRKEIRIFGMHNNFSDRVGV